MFKLTHRITQQEPTDELVLPAAVYVAISENRESIFARLQTSLESQAKTPVCGFSFCVHRRGRVYYLLGHCAVELELNLAPLNIKETLKHPSPL